MLYIEHGHFTKTQTIKNSNFYQKLKLFTKKPELFQKTQTFKNSSFLTFQKTQAFKNPSFFKKPKLSKTRAF